VIGVGVPTYPSGFARVGDLCGRRLYSAIPANLPIALYRQRTVGQSVEEIELTVQLDVGPRLPRSCRHA